ncbi:hypothetical protein M885DRAFT_535115 [Pelagophyceae sp. CCMP2097]|nr:hypothetical protein M885DRAFT_535115 [Pelagophyceae sp. CCMP2097]
MATLAEKRRTHRVRFLLELGPAPEVASAPAAPAAAPTAAHDTAAHDTAAQASSGGARQPGDAADGLAGAPAAGDAPRWSAAAGAADDSCAACRVLAEKLRSCDADLLRSEALADSLAADVRALEGRGDALERAKVGDDEALDSRLTALEARNAALEERNADLEQQLEAQREGSGEASPQRSRAGASAAQRRIEALEAEVSDRDAKVRFLETHLSTMDAHVAALIAGDDAMERAAYAVGTETTPKRPTTTQPPAPAPAGAALSDELELARAALQGADAASAGMLDALEAADTEMIGLRARVGELEIEVEASRVQLAAADAASRVDVGAVHASSVTATAALASSTTAAGGLVGAAVSEAAELLRLELSSARLAEAGAYEALGAALAAHGALAANHRRGADADARALSRRYVDELAELTQAKAERDAASQRDVASDAARTAADARAIAAELRLETARADVLQVDALRSQLISAQARGNDATDRLDSSQRAAARAGEARDAANAAHEALRSLLESERLDLVRGAQTAVEVARQEAQRSRDRAADFEAAAARAYAEAARGGLPSARANDDATAAAADRAAAAADRAAAAADRDRASQRAALSASPGADAGLRDVAAAARDAQQSAAEDRALAVAERRDAGDALARVAADSREGWRRGRAWVAVLLLECASARQARCHARLAFQTWRRYDAYARWRSEARRARAHAVRAATDRVTSARLGRAWGLWARAARGAPPPRGEAPWGRSPRSSDKENSKENSLPYDAREAASKADRAAAAAHEANAAAWQARDAPAGSPVVLFRESRDSPHGVVGIDGKQLCAAFQFGSCEHQGQTGLVMHRGADGFRRAAWQWHACAACARGSGQFQAHSRFSEDGAEQSCPHANLTADAAPLPKDTTLARRFESVSSQLRFQEGCIKNYERQKNDLMSALGTALMRLNALGAHYPHWVWEKYEKGRSERYTYFVSNI